MWVPGETQTTTESGTVSGSSSGSVYGSDGYAHASGSYGGRYSGQQTTTTSGKVVHVPYEATRYDYGATYWAKRDPKSIVFGAIVVPLSQERREELQRNTGAEVAVVIEGTPAFRANILRGDVITQVGTTAITDVDSFMQAITRQGGQLVDVRLLRKGRLHAARLTIRGSR